MLKRSILTVAFLFAIGIAGLTGFALCYFTEYGNEEGEIQMTNIGNRPDLNRSEEVRSAPGHAPRAAGLNPSGDVTPAAPPAPSALSFVRFTDPTEGAFTLEVPRGWQVRGGLNHAGLGDFRWFVEARSPDGITIIQGDPNCPQIFYHYANATEEVMYSTPQGCTYLSLPPQAKRLANYYLKNVAPQRFGPLKITGQRDRSDPVAEELDRVRQQGSPVPGSYKVSVHEIRFEAGGRVGCCFAASGYDPNQPVAVLGQTGSSGCPYVWLAPPALTAVAEKVQTHMRNTFRITPRMAQVIQQDEVYIASNGAAANLNQQEWFRAQQGRYRQQLETGEVYIDGERQRQAVNDRVFQDQSDTTLGQQRLVDDATGRPYDHPSVHNYYWLDQNGKVVGTDTSEPPDYQQNYTPLRKQ
jgi:hypothetical protein